MKNKYILIGGNPFTGYTRTTTFTSLKIVGSGNTKKEIQKLIKKNYDACCGLFIVVDAESGEEPDWFKDGDWG